MSRSVLPWVRDDLAAVLDLLQVRVFGPLKGIGIGADADRAAHQRLTHECLAVGVDDAPCGTPTCVCTVLRSNPPSNDHCRLVRTATVCLDTPWVDHRPLRRCTLRTHDRASSRPVRSMPSAPTTPVADATTKDNTRTTSIVESDAMGPDDDEGDAEPEPRQAKTPRSTTAACPRLESQ